MPAVMQRQVPTIQKVPETVEVSKVQFVDKGVDVPVIVQARGPAFQVVMPSLWCRYP